MPTEVTRYDDDELAIALHEIETLTGWPDLAGYVLVAIGKTPAPDGRLRVYMLADTSDAKQIVALLGRVVVQLDRDVAH